MDKKKTNLWQKIFLRKSFGRKFAIKNFYENIWFQRTSILISMK